MSSPSDIEKTSLEAHVSLCELRYQSLERRLNSLEQQLDALQTLLSQIHHTLSQLPQQQNQRWDRAQLSLIGVLTAALGWALARIFA